MLFLSVHKGGLGNWHRCRTHYSTYKISIHHRLHCLLRDCLRDKSEHRHGGLWIYLLDRYKNSATLGRLNVRIEIISRKRKTDHGDHQPHKTEPENTEDHEKHPSNYCIILHLPNNCIQHLERPKNATIWFCHFFGMLHWNFGTTLRSFSRNGRYSLNHPHQ